MKTEDAEKFVGWLVKEIVSEARGERIHESSFEPSGRFWLGRLAPEETVIELGLGDRGQRLDPCAIGLRMLLPGDGPWEFDAEISACGWIRADQKEWSKSDPITVSVPCTVNPEESTATFGRAGIEAALSEVMGVEGLSLEVRTEKRRVPGHTELTVLLVNVSPAKHDDLKDTNLYECRMGISGLETAPFVLEALPDSFRYDRRLIAYGINCGVEERHGKLVTADVVEADQYRPYFWSVDEQQPDLSFDTLADDPIPHLKRLVSAHEEWGEEAWGERSLKRRAARENWSKEMLSSALAAAGEFEKEKERLQNGLAALEDREDLLRAFKLMNQAMKHSSQRRDYNGWRPFQVGFLLCNVASIIEPSPEAPIADLIWFPTGGGKTETYLGLLGIAALYDRIRGKTDGITAWSRFPLRMLSLQQTQRFADAMAGAELARRSGGIGGSPFSVGFFVGAQGTPNRIEPDPDPPKPDPTDPNMPEGFQVLNRCPFCHEESISMAFDRRYWRLEHQCTNDECPWHETGLPFYIVDDEIFRFLPTVIVGTLDKAALIAWQAAMRGFVGPPRGRCSGEGHGFVYATRSKRPNGCLVPGCRGSKTDLGMDPELFAPSFRLQDELHLLRDSLGAVDAHYEALFDHLQQRTSRTSSKILASSATLTGYEKQVDVLYARQARVFPVPSPSAESGFWVATSDHVMRRYVAIAPRGVTLEFCIDRILTDLQRAIRRFKEDPERICSENGIDPNSAAHLVSIYGTDVVYGNTLRDLDAVARSLETQVQVEGSLNTATLTGRTHFKEVRSTLNRLEDPEEDFEDRLHVITASSMMSHGVDIDRLNIMAMLGLPLTTSEFIQATARVGRRWPGIVFVTHKIARERDAAIYGSFNKYIEHGDRFVEPIPITRRSRRVLERTIAGLEHARIYMLHEPDADTALTVVSRLREYAEEHDWEAEEEVRALVEALELDDALSEPLRDDIEAWCERFFYLLRDPVGDVTFPSDLFPTGKPMLSLRDVEEQAPVHMILDD